MRVLNILFLVCIDILRGILLPEVFFDVGARHVFGLFGDTHRVGSDIGDQTDRSRSLDLHAFIELLRDHHRSFGRKIQLVGGILLQTAGGKRRERFTLPFPAHDGCDPITAGREICEHLVCLSFARDADLFLLIFGDLSGKEFALFEFDLDIPVFLWFEILYFVFAVTDDFECRGLYTSRAQSSAYLAPKKRTDLITHQAIQRTSGLLRVHQTDVNGTRRLDCLFDRILCNFVEHDATWLIRVQSQEESQMPGDCLSLAVRVGCQIDFSGSLRLFFELLDQIALPADRNILWLKIVFHVDAQFALRQVSDMSDRSNDLIGRAQIFADGFRLGRRFHDDQCLFRRRLGCGFSRRFCACLCFCRCFFRCLRCHVSSTKRYFPSMLILHFPF